MRLVPPAPQLREQEVLLVPGRLEREVRRGHRPPLEGARPEPEDRRDPQVRPEAARPHAAHRPEGRSHPPDGRNRTRRR